MPQATIKGAERRIADVFSDEFAFSIPMYQRPYAWGKDEAGELLDDVLSFAGEPGESLDTLAPYFLGSIVLIKDEGEAESEVIDGQQRLATLTMLFAALRDLAPTDAKQFLKRFIVEEADPYRGTESRYRLTIRQRDQEFFQRYVQTDDGIAALDTLVADSLADSQRNIRENALHFYTTLSSMSPQDRDQLARFVGNKCYLVVVSTTDQESAYRVFSVLNDRGMDLSHADILKSEIIGQLAPDDQSTYAARWEETEEDLGKEAFEDLFAHVRMIYAKAKLEETVLNEFRKHVVRGRSAKSVIDDVLLPHAEAYWQVQKCAFDGSPEAEGINRLLRWLNGIDNVDWVPPALACINRCEGSVEPLPRFLKDLERLAASMMIRRVYRTTRIGRYGDLLKAMEDGEAMYGEDSPLQLSEDENAKTREALSGSIYELRNVPRYVLLRLDDLLSGEGATYDYPVISVEHVLPQKPEQDSQWLSDFPDEEERKQLVHCLGNLVLLSRRKNSSARNYEFHRKKATYFATTNEGASPFVITNQVIAEDAWTPDVIRERQRELLEHLSELWRL